MLYVRMVGRHHAGNSSDVTLRLAFEDAKFFPHFSRMETENTDDTESTECTESRGDS